MDGGIPRICEFGVGGTVCSRSDERLQSYWPASASRRHDNCVRLAHRRVSHHSVFGTRTPHDVTSLVAFAGSTLIVSITEWFRTIRRRAVAAIAVLRGRADALEREHQEPWRLAREPEQANKKLEQALDVATRAQSESAKQGERLKLLDQVSSVLATSLDYQRAISTTAKLAVPAVADWCCVDVLVGNEIRQLGVSYVDTPELRRYGEVRARYAIDPNAQTGVAKAFRTGELVFAPEVSDSTMVQQARSPEHLEAMRAAKFRSGMVVPMVARGHTIGVLTMASVERRFDQWSPALGRDIAQRAAIAIDNAQLYQTVVVANDAKATFLATMSHELRTPLTAIIGYEELLGEGVTGELNDGQRQQLSRIKANAQQLLALIEEILLYARVGAGRAEVHLDEVHVQAVVNEAIAVVAPTAGHLALTAELPNPTLTLRTDGDKLRQMLINVIENAVTFTERGRATVRAFERGADVVFEVQDTGIGIAPENRELVFEPFWQADRTRPHTELRPHAPFRDGAPSWCGPSRSLRSESRAPVSSFRNRASKDDRSTAWSSR
jgi:signal transduction histidine kinase